MRTPPPRAPPQTAGIALLFGLTLTACNSTAWPDREPTVIENAGVDSLTFWPPRAYALPSDLLAVELLGLRHVYDCARILSLAWDSADSAGGRHLRPHARVELPAIPDCAISNGLDTLLETTAPAAGQRLYLHTPDGRITDSLLSITGNAVVESFLRTSDTLQTFGRYTFRDSTAGHPQRTLITDTLATCEIVQAAVLRRNQTGTHTVWIRTILASTLPPEGFPACAGPRVDTLNVHRDRYLFP